MSKITASTSHPVTALSTRSAPTWQDDGGHGHETVEVNGGVEGDVSVEEGLSAQGDEVAAHGEEHVRK